MGSRISFSNAQNVADHFDNAVQSDGSDLASESLLKEAEDLEVVLEELIEFVETALSRDQTTEKVGR